MDEYVGMVLGQWNTLIPYIVNGFLINDNTYIRTSSGIGHVTSLSPSNILRFFLLPGQWQITKKVGERESLIVHLWIHASNTRHISCSLDYLLRWASILFHGWLSSGGFRSRVAAHVYGLTGINLRILVESWGKCIRYTHQDLDAILVWVAWLRIDPISCVNPLPIIGNSLKKQKSLYKVLTPKLPK